MDARPTSERITTIDEPPCRPEEASECNSSKMGQHDRMGSYGHNYVGPVLPADKWGGLGLPLSLYLPFCRTLAASRCFPMLHGAGKLKTLP